MIYLVYLFNCLFYFVLFKDNSVPNFEQVNEFIEQSIKVIDEEKHAVVVHCAAGIGNNEMTIIINKNEYNNDNKRMNDGD